MERACFYPEYVFYEYSASSEYFYRSDVTRGFAWFQSPSRIQVFKYFQLTRAPSSPSCERPLSLRLAASGVLGDT